MTCLRPVWSCALVIAAMISACGRDPIVHGLGDARVDGGGTDSAENRDLGPKDAPASADRSSDILLTPGCSIASTGQGSTLRGVWGTSQGEVYVAGEGGTILRSVHDGPWEVQYSACCPSLRDVWGSSPSDIVVVGGSTILNFDGLSWASALDPKGSLGGVSGSSKDDVWAVGSDGFIFRRQANGTWGIADHVDLPLTAVWAATETDAWAVGANGVAYRFDGSAWVHRPTGVSDALHDVWGSSATSVWIVGEFGRILHSDGSSTPFDVHQSPKPFDLNSVWGRSPSEVWAVGRKGTVLQYDGHQWLTHDCGTTEDLNAVWVSETGRLVAVGDGGIVVRYVP
jgi:hypothetical protein